MKKLYSILLALSLIFCGLPGLALDGPEGFICYGGMITALTGPASAAEELTIPAEIDGRPVEAIYSIRSTALKRLTLPPTVHTIHSEAFVGCPNLESINLDNVTTVHGRAFAGCRKLTSVTSDGKNLLPRSCQLGMYAFLGTGLEDLVLSGSLFSGAAGGMNDLGIFKGCADLKWLSLRNGVKIIGREAFMGCVLLDYFCLPMSVNELRENAFSGCTGLRTAVFPAKNITLTDGIFDGCPGLTILGMAGTTAEAYARARGINFVPSIITRNEVSSIVSYAEQRAEVTVNGVVIPAYTLGGSIYVGENALKCLGIDCEWDRPGRSTYVTVPEGTVWSAKINEGPAPYGIYIFSSDTSFYLNGRQIPALNVGNGESIIDVNALAGKILY